ncbi:hypothetical protein JW911_00085 [Candidatus Peregrinibacteria bacterium]|nr:hypothetical protein [Candidatus Peregrinibacteria bacterium]
MQYSIVNYKTVKEESHSLRIDADFFRADYLSIQDKLKSKSFKKLIDYKIKIKHPTEIKREYVDDGVLFLRAQNVRPLQIDIENNPVYISNKDAVLLKNNLITKKDILLTRTGANFGQCSIFLDNQQAIASSHTFIIKGGELNPFFLAVFLNTNFGRKLIDKGMYGGLQPEVAPFFLYQIPLPIFKVIPDIIEKIYLLSQKYIDDSKSLYSQAETLLLSELGLLDWKPKHTLSFVKNYSDMQEVERIDAEYFQPKYEEIIEAVKKYKGGFDELGNLVKIKDKNFTPKDNEQYKYIELANISSNGEINGYTENFGNELPSRARRKVQKSDLIVSSIEGSLDSIALITEDWKNALCSTGFFAVNSDKLNSETLLVLLKTKVGQLQLKKGCKGTILTAVGKDELSKIVLPKIDSETQKEIKGKITEMYKTKKLSKSLLEIAKRGVEIAIEKDEQEAEKWINSEIVKLGIDI